MQLFFDGEELKDAQSVDQAISQVTPKNFKYIICEKFIFNPQNCVHYRPVQGEMSMRISPRFWPLHCVATMSHCFR